MKIFINPGHCPGIDPGAVNKFFVIQEATISLRVGEWLQELLLKAGHKVKLLQQHELRGISDAANAWGAELFICIHCNAATNTNARGTETLVYSKNSVAAEIAAEIQKQIVQQLGTVDRGIKERPELSVLKRTKMPAVYCELAFISNNRDAGLLVTKHACFANAIAEGIKNYIKSTSEGE